MSEILKFKVTPTNVNGRLKREMIESIITTARQMSGSPDDYKYNYDFGFKQIGNALLDIKQNSHQWLEPLDVELVIKCTAPQEKRIQFVNIKTDQTSNIQDAKIINGGIDQNSIEILITARNTFWFKYDARFYETTLIGGIEELNQDIQLYGSH